LLETSDPRKSTPIELLVLSACEIITGDLRAALGLAGVAVKAGARITLATLWQINDESTALFMETFYRELIQKGVSKAEALSKAQQHLSQTANFQHPYYWASYVLLGNWL
jgi:CHAT domain-containing protein